MVDVTAPATRPEPAEPPPPPPLSAQHPQDVHAQAGTLFDHDPLPLARLASAAEMRQATAQTDALAIPSTDERAQHEAILLAERYLTRRHGLQGMLTDDDWIAATAAVSDLCSVPLSDVRFGAVNDAVSGIVNDRFERERLAEEVIILELESEEDDAAAYMADEGAGIWDALRAAQAASPCPSVEPPPEGAEPDPEPEPDPDPDPDPVPDPDPDPEPPEPADMDVDTDQANVYERVFGRALDVARLKKNVSSHLDLDGASPSEIEEAFTSEALRLKQLSRRGRRAPRSCSILFQLKFEPSREGSIEWFNTG